MTQDAKRIQPDSKKAWFTMFTLESHFSGWHWQSLCRHWFSWARNLARIRMFCFIIPDTGSQLAMFVHQGALPDYHPSFQKKHIVSTLCPCQNMSKHTFVATKFSGSVGKSHRNLTARNSPGCRHPQRDLTTSVVQILSCLVATHKTLVADNGV